MPEDTLALIGRAHQGTDRGTGADCDTGPDKYTYVTHSCLINAHTRQSDFWDVVWIWKISFRSEVSAF